MIKLENISKKYIISHEKQTLVRNILPLFLHINRYQEFWALRDINLEFDLNRCFGIIGNNGSGKTSLLNIISGVTTPTTGRVIVNGKISTLLTLGAGFHPELTGEENIYLNGAILGMTRGQVSSKLKNIIDFCQLNSFIDAPLRTYSAGMQMRLGFAIAIHVDFDILLIDEVFSVGDIAFQKKCLDKMKEFRCHGKTIILVSHSLDLIREFCDEVILMDSGRIIYRSTTSDLINKYQEMMNTNPKEKEVYKKDYEIDKSISLEKYNFKNESTRPPIIIDLDRNAETVNPLTLEAQISEVRFLDSKDIEKSVFETGERIKVSVGFKINEEILDPHFGIAIFRDNGIYCFGPNTRFDGLKIDKLKRGDGQITLEYKSLNLLPGKYLVSIAIWEKDEKFAYDYHYARYPFEIVSNKRDHGICFIEHKWMWSLPK